MAIFIANENGDWWQVDGDHRVLYVLDTDDLPEDVAAEWADENGEIDWTDEDTIMEYGKIVPQLIVTDYARYEK